MILKLAALGALGYAGFKVYEKNKDSFRLPRTRQPQPALAGGSLSSEARVQDNAGPPTG